MKRMLGVLAVATFLCAASAASGQTPGHDSVTGDGVIDFTSDGFWTEVLVDARSGPSGENPSGTLTLQICGIQTTSRACTQSGSVTCLNVTGNRAVFAWFGPVFAANFPVRLRGLVEITDNGSPGAGRDTLQIVPSHIVFSNGYDASIDVPITDCPASLPGDGTPLFAGDTSPWGFTQDYVVNDAAALPSSKDQCNNGGWRNFDVFKNQGDCVSYVSTKGTNPPGGH
jgi:hypothetical protein